MFIEALDGIVLLRYLVPVVGLIVSAGCAVQLLSWLTGN